MPSKGYVAVKFCIFILFLSAVTAEEGGTKSVAASKDETAKVDTQERGATSIGFAATSTTCGSSLTGTTPSSTSAVRRHLTGIPRRHAARRSDRPRTFDITTDRRKNLHCRARGTQIHDTLSLGPGSLSFGLPFQASQPTAAAAGTALPAGLSFRRGALDR